jgi:Fur family transcriptional regulator, zinc uptake regulator
MSVGESSSRRGRRRAGAAHDHSHCEGHGAHLAGLNLTPGRQAILDMLCAAGKPLGAYEMIDRLVDANGRRPAPISVYPALDYLVENGLVHRLATRNAFLACAHRHKGADPIVFLICEACGKVEETASSSLGASLLALSSSHDFKPNSQMIEISGVCAACAAAKHA